MRLLSTTLLCVFIGLCSQAQVFHNELSSGCDIEVAFAISESEGTGEYVLTDLILLNPGVSWDFRKEALSARNLFAGEDYEIMFIVRYPNSGVTYYIDGNSKDGFERMITGCLGGPKLIYTRDGEFHFDRYLK